MEARRGDPSIFTSDYIALPDDKIVEVVQIIEDVGFTLCNIDTLGAAFEHFFGSVFRGDLGQYFTRREIVRFVLGVLNPKDTDFILDPTGGSGGFLLESLIQVWHYIVDHYSGQPDIERRKIDFALNHIFGIEIHSILGRVCKTNLLIHKDGHTNVEVERSCLDSNFSIPSLRPNGSIFTLVVGNPPFGDEIREGDIDRLGNGSLADFDQSRGLNQINSELIIIERGLQFLIPGGRLGMVIPDGALNNSGEISHCPSFRRFILKNTKVEMIVSLPDYAFRKAGAQNKTSIIFLKKYTKEEKNSYNSAYRESLDQQGAESDPTIIQENLAIRYALEQNRYSVFFSEVDHIGYTPSGTLSSKNQLFSINDATRLNLEDFSTVLGQYNLYLQSPTDFVAASNPSCHSMDIVDVIDSHASFRLDPKFHLFQLERIKDPPSHMKEDILANLLIRREEQINPNDYPDHEFLTLKLSQNGTLSPREAGKGKNPPSWHGVYFSDGSRWYRCHTNDLIFSQIDLWKGCVAVIPPEFDQAIVTQEFPVYQVDTSRLNPRYLALLLRSKYFQRAIRAITTGHSNRRRTQREDFENIRIFLPDIDTQSKIANFIEDRYNVLIENKTEYEELITRVEKVILGQSYPADFLDKNFALSQ